MLQEPWAPLALLHGEVLNKPPHLHFHMQKPMTSPRLIKAAYSVGLVCISMMTFGCASITNDTTHPVRVDVMTNGKSTSVSECKLTNDYGQVNFRSGDTVQVRRSSKDLDLFCSSGVHPDARGRAISRANGGMFGNILLGGGIGAVIDHNRGTAYTYPTWMQLVPGQELTFDRNDEKEGQPVPGRNMTLTPAVSGGQPGPAVTSPPASPN